MGSRGGGRPTGSEEHVEHVARVAHEGGAVLEQRVGPAGLAGRDAPGHGADVAPELHREVRVISDPDRSAASTTTVTWASPAMIRLRAGNDQLKGRNPGGISDTTQPDSTSRRVDPRLHAG